MSDIINNRQFRQNELKRLIMNLHAGESVDQVKAEFQATFKDVAASEISEMEAALIQEGLAVEDIQRLCDVHASLFDGNIQAIHQKNDPADTPGHPVHTMKMENKAIEAHIQDILLPRLKSFASNPTRAMANVLAGDFLTLLELDKHYSRKENLIFPYMERYGITAPPKVMWGVDDEIRKALKAIRSDLLDETKPVDTLLTDADQALTKVRDMISKEENILFPLVLETLTEDEWKAIESESAEIGFCLFEPEEEWKPERRNLAGNVDVSAAASLDAAPGRESILTGADALHPDSRIHLETGIVTLSQLEALMSVLPIDFTFIDAEDTVCWFSNSADRIFARTKAVIGRKVHNCHPPASVHVVEALLNDFKSGKKNSEDFWIKMGPRTVYIRYFAVRDKNGRYIGTVELTQDIAPIQQLTGEKRIADVSPDA